MKNESAIVCVCRQTKRSSRARADVRRVVAKQCTFNRKEMERGCAAPAKLETLFGQVVNYANHDPRRSGIPLTAPYSPSGWLSLRGHHRQLYRRQVTPHAVVLPVVRSARSPRT